MRLTGAPMPEPPPSLTRRMRHDRPRPCVLPRIALDVPRVNVRQAVVATVRLHVEGSDHRLPLPNLHASTSSARMARTHREAITAPSSPRVRGLPLRP